ncbi:hypothetical protein Cob_v005570 [Colletotrichum orbiculare MAFF 240422]|uniref:Uncharacterized protein n=1 Tax=Colletotrichum orbiculare (strain 104-T / ATCC 96160 / CBS 514.97 / LARS 414 / MAFF 240422) TaxID=1213857 RepID=A0A484FU18_COLOR|nr:hypothetical protein Cob_v005570 [Colletotrichum orbiculare MAFF 240422]
MFQRPSTKPPLLASDKPLEHTANGVDACRHRRFAAVVLCIAFFVNRLGGWAGIWGTAEADGQPAFGRLRSSLFPSLVQDAKSLATVDVNSFTKPGASQ